MAQLPHYLLTLDETGDLGIQETSFVEYPATGLGFLAFEEEKVEHKFARIDEQKYQRLVSGVLMMPKTKYLRQTKEGNFYTVEFSAETLKQALVKYLKEDKAGVVKVEHKGRPLDGFAAVEHWIIEDNTTKSPVLGYTLADLGYNPDEIPAGTIMKTTYVADEQFWNDQILSGKVSGYSLGGFFELKEVEAKTQEFSTNPAVPTIQDVLKLIGVEGDNIKVTSKEGKQLQFGQTVSEGNELANGTYEFNTDLKIVVKDGVIVDYGFESNPSDDVSGFDKENNNNENTIEMSEVQTQTTESNVQVTTETTPNVTTEANVTTETTNVSTESTTPITPVVPEQNISAPSQAELSELSAKLDNLTAQMTEKDNKIAELEAKLAKLDEKNAALKEKLKEEPVKKTTPTHNKPFGNDKPEVKKVPLKIGNITVTV